MKNSFSILFVATMLATILLGSISLTDAHAQIEPFELQLQQIRDPQECTKKLI